MFDPFGPVYLSLGSLLDGVSGWQRLSEDSGQPQLEYEDDVGGRHDAYGKEEQCHGADRVVDPLGQFVVDASAGLRVKGSPDWPLFTAFCTAVVFPLLKSMIK